MPQINKATNHIAFSHKAEWIKAHIPSISTVVTVALKALAVTGVIVFSIYFPFTAMALSVTSYVAFRLLMEYTQHKIGKFYHNNPNLGNETYEREHRRMLQAIKVMDAISRNRHLAQFVSLAAIAAFWRVKAPLVILGFAATATIVAIDYIDSSKCIERLQRQVHARIFNNPAAVAQELRLMRIAYPDDTQEQLRQKCVTEADCRPLRMEYQRLINQHTANAFAFLARSRRLDIEEGPTDPEVIQPLGQLSVVFEIEANANVSHLMRSPLLRKRLNAISDTREQYLQLTGGGKRRLKQRIVDPDSFRGGSAQEESVYRAVCELCLWNPEPSAFLAGTEKHDIRKLRVGRYLKSRVIDGFNLVFHPSKPRSL